MAKDFTGIICIPTGKVLDSGNDPFCVNHWQDLVNAESWQTSGLTREGCINLNCCKSIDQLKDWQSKAHVLAKLDLKMPGPGEVVKVPECTIVHSPQRFLQPYDDSDKQATSEPQLSTSAKGKTSTKPKRSRKPKTQSETKKSEE